MAAKKRERVLLDEEQEPSLEELIRSGMEPKAGRPTSLTLEVLARLETAAQLLQGPMMQARAAGVSYTTLKDWKKRYPALARRLEEAGERTGAALLKRELSDALSGDKESRRFMLKHLHPDFHPLKRREEAVIDAMDDEDTGEGVDFTYC